jgi:hypothetical protein
MEERIHNSLCRNRPAFWFQREAIIPLRVFCARGVRGAIAFS